MLDVRLVEGDTVDRELVGDILDRARSTPMFFPSCPMLRSLSVYSLEVLHLLRHLVAERRDTSHAAEEAEPQHAEALERLAEAAGHLHDLVSVSALVPSFSFSTCLLPLPCRRRAP